MLAPSPPLRLPTPFFFNDPATTEIYTLSLHDALPISQGRVDLLQGFTMQQLRDFLSIAIFQPAGDRKSTRLNSSHRCISYAVFCLKKKRRSAAPRLSGCDCTTGQPRRTGKRAPGG